MTFDFTNYTFSGLLSVLAALYGIGYPLIIQNIERIYSQYDSSLLSDRFTNEHIYKTFQVLLVFNLIFAVSVPFLLHAEWWPLVTIIIQAVLLVLLMGTTFMLFQLMIKYGNAGKLLEHIESNQIDESNVLDILDLAIYADSKNNHELFVDCMSDVYHYIRVQQGDDLLMNINSKLLPPVDYDEITTGIILKLKGYVGVDDGHHMLYRNAGIVSIIYNQLSKSRISIQGHHLLWILLNEVITKGNHSWFKSYWQYADSYSSTKYRFVDIQELRQDKTYYMLRHVMVGALMVHHERYTWMNDIFFFTHSEPEYYGLIPSSFAEIVKMLYEVDKICTFPNFQEHRLYFVDEMSGVKDEKYVFREAVRYLSLLVIRLYSLDLKDIFSMPKLPVLIVDDDRASVLMDMMKVDIEKYYNKNIFEQISRLSKIDKGLPIGLVEEYKLQCGRLAKRHIDHPDVDDKKFEELEQEAFAFADSIYHYLPTEPPAGVTAGNWRELQEIVRTNEKIDTIHYSPYFDIANKQCVWYNFKFEIGRLYDRVVNTIHKLGVYYIKPEEMATFWDRIGYSSDKYRVIATDDFTGQEECVNMNAGVLPKHFYILPVNDIPYVSFHPLEEEKLHPIKTESAISSNYVHFLDCHEPTFNLIVATRMTVAFNNNAVGSVLVIIDNNPENNESMKIDMRLDDLYNRMQLCPEKIS